MLRKILKEFSKFLRNIFQVKSSEINLRNGALLQAHLPQPLKALQGGMYIPQSISLSSLYSKSDKIIRDTLCRAAVHCLAMSSVLFFGHFLWPSLESCIVYISIYRDSVMPIYSVWRQFDNLLPLTHSWQPPLNGQVAMSLSLPRLVINAGRETEVEVDWLF